MRKLNQTSFARKPTKLVVLKGGHFAAALVLPLAVAQLAFGQAGPPPLPVQLPPRPAPPPPVTAPVPQVLAGHVPPRIAALGLTPMGPLPATQQLNLAIGLPLRNQQGLADFLVQLNDPESANYRRFLTSDEFAAAYGPAESDYESVIAFAQAQNLVVTATYSNRVLVDVIGSAADIERAFNVNLLLYQHPMEDRQFYAPEAEPSVDLSVPLLYISGRMITYCQLRSQAVAPAQVAPLWGATSGPRTCLARRRPRAADRASPWSRCRASTSRPTSPLTKARTNCPHPTRAS
ncbi:MAG: protease pro-enzyme activation domain-containing protein [Limisphaerales bacterium]